METGSLIFDFEKATNLRSKNIEKYIDCDVTYNDSIIAYTTMPNDPISAEVYQMFKAKKVSIAPGEDYDWIDGKWVQHSQERIYEMQQLSEEAKKQQITLLTNQIEALKDKINLGISTDVDADKEKLLSLTKERAMLV